MTRDAFNDIIRQLDRKLYVFAFRILRKREDAEDAVQEIFIKLWKMKETLEGYNSIEALATTMVKNFCIDGLRKKRPDLEEDLGNYANIGNSSDSPHEQMEIKESDALIHSIIKELPDHYRNVIMLRDVQGFSYEEIAIKTGHNINTLRVNLSRARSIIREQYNKYQNEKRGIGQVTGKVL